MGENYVDISSSERHRFVGISNVLISVYWDSPGAHVLADRIAWVSRTIRQHGGVGSLVIVHGARSLPSAEFRRVSGDQGRQWSGKILFSSVALVGEGMQMTLLRALLRGLQLAQPKKEQVPLKFHQSIKAACAWAEEQNTTDSVTQSELIAICRELQRG